MPTLEATVEFLSFIIKANRLHEPYCIAFSTAKGDSFGLTSYIQSSTEKQCYCWLDKDNRAPEGQGFGAYHIKTETLVQPAFLNRYYARLSILEQNPDLSNDPKAENHWGKTFYIVPVTISEQPS